MNPVFQPQSMEAKWAAEAYTRALLAHCRSWGLLFDYRAAGEGDEDAANFIACVQSFVEKCSARVDVDAGGMVRLYLHFPGQL